MTTMQAVELNKKTITNGHVIITYKSGDFVFYNEYLNENDAQSNDPKKIISKSYIQKDKNGGHIHIYLHPQQQNKILKTLAYNKNNQISLETHFWDNKNKKLVRFYSNGILTHAWDYTENGKIKLGTSYQKNSQNKYDIVSVSLPIFDKKNELSHLIVKETEPNGHPTGKIIERTFYLLDKPSVRACYVLNKTTGQTDEVILSQENGKWLEVKDPKIQKQLSSLFKNMLQLETPQNRSNLTLEKNSDITFEELYYHDVFKFKQTHSDLNVFVPDDTQLSLNQTDIN